MMGIGGGLPYLSQQIMFAIAQWVKFFRFKFSLKSVPIPCRPVYMISHRILMIAWAALFRHCWQSNNYLSLSGIHLLLSFSLRWVHRQKLMYNVLSTLLRRRMRRCEVTSWRRYECVLFNMQRTNQIETQGAFKEFHVLRSAIPWFASFNR